MDNYQCACGEMCRIASDAVSVDRWGVAACGHKIAARVALLSECIGRIPIIAGFGSQSDLLARFAADLADVAVAARKLADARRARAMVAA